MYYDEKMERLKELVEPLAETGRKLNEAAANVEIYHSSPSTIENPIPIMDKETAAQIIDEITDKIP